MTATLSMVPVAQIRPSKANPRAEFDDEQMAELIESVKRHGIITPLTLSRDGDGRYAIIAGERRYRAAKAAKLREVPAQVREVEGEALTLAVAENVIRADLSPLEEARAYRRLVDEHGDAAKVAQARRQERAAGRASGSNSCGCRSETQELLAARRVPLACAPSLVEIAEREPLLADLDGRLARGAPAGRGGLPGRSGRGRGRRARGRVDGRRREAAAPGRLQRRRLPRPDPPARPRARGHARGACWRSSARTPRRSTRPSARCRRSSTPPSTTGRPASAEERRERECFALSDDDADAARAFGCLLELAGANGRRDHRYVTDAEWLADRLVQKIAAHVAAEAERTASAERAARRARPARRRRREGGAPRAAAARLRGARVGPRAQPRPRRGARAVGAEARHRRGEAARLARPRSTTARRRRGRTGSASSSRRRRTSRAR